MPALGNTSQLRVYRDGATGFVTLSLKCGQAIDAKWQPDITYVVRIREKGVAEWCIGFETSITGCTFIDLKPDTDYEVQIRSKTARSESAPTYTSIRTNSAGGTTNIITFPKR